MQPRTALDTELLNSVIVTVLCYSVSICLHDDNYRVASTGVIKVADFGLTEDIYQQSYFRQDSSCIQLPIKWMALESLHDKLFSEKSDVVHSLYNCRSK